MEAGFLFVVRKETRARHAGVRISLAYLRGLGMSVQQLADS